MSDPCEQYRCQLAAYISGELDGLEYQAITEHLAECEDCRLARGELEATAALLRETYRTCAMPEIDIDRAWRKVEARLDFGPSRWQRFKKLFVGPLIWGPAIAVAALAILIVRPGIRDNQPDPGSVARAPVNETLPPAPTQPAGDTPAKVCSVESVYSRSGNVMLLQTAGSGQPLIWILPEKKNQGEKS